jgi:hypothetical protein
VLGWLGWLGAAAPLVCVTTGAVDATGAAAGADELDVTAGGGAGAGGGAAEAIDG